MLESEKTTNDVRIQVSSRPDVEHTRPHKSFWFFLYTVTITNEGIEPVQLVSRHWVITDGDGRVEEVQGDGVVGEQPILGPGESFRYTSGCPLNTPFGTMHGTYQMVTAGGEGFDAEIAPFLLSEPQSVH